ncbi:MAG: aminoacyl-tRNA hydrolase [Caldilineaceae bacterium SB0675_bin_29]|uniref:Peptidyl-tRNA hydrolase n=1 Tax=Caldilineaceae bacterium SB0675_bin_29 TaxID=2605266 RepID=A0A6B1FYZ2_9CHLR|nr:aminoacyl-tRNA hydrolase [Caldilineaceae bacterium SB0675_bin_29]
MKMIVGLGNPGPQYARNRHNIGFQVADVLARRHGISLSRSKYNALYGLGTIPHSRAVEYTRLPEKGSSSQKALIVRPLTFMNLSGNAVAQMAKYFRVEPQDIFVVYDELDLPSGRLRLRPFGGSGGHNGMKSLIRMLGTDRFPRARVGIGRPDSPMSPADYVLQNFSADEEVIFESLRHRIADAVETWLFYGIDLAMNRYNSTPATAE